jgi:glyoxylase-like metal-dependent hydrolase (beta-lactamase superfamily II)
MERGCTLLPGTGSTSDISMKRGKLDRTRGRRSMAEALPEYELFAIRYATREARRADHFIGGDPHDAPMPMDYFVWLAKGAGRAVVIDAGFTEATAHKRKRTFLRCPVEALGLLGVDAGEVEDVVLTHLHYDHAGNFHRFPRARFHLQEPELHFAVGRYMRFQKLAHSFEVEDVVGIVRLNYARRVSLHNGRHDLAPGIELHPAPGHSAGLQFVRVHTRRGWVVVASDVTHYYEHMETERVFTTAFHIGQMLEGFDLLRAAAPSPAHIVPGHDPLVMRRYPPPRPELEGIAVRLDVAPRD